MLVSLHPAWITLATYSVTTISGPPLAVLSNNQGLVKRDFRAGLALIRVAESSLTAMAYWQLGMFTAASLSVTGLIAPGVLIGIPLDLYLLARFFAKRQVRPRRPVPLV